MTKTEKFIEVLQTFDRPITVSAWAKRIAELYPAVLIQSNSKTDSKMTLVELTTAISIKLSKGELPQVEIENALPYRKVYYLSNSAQKALIKEHANRDREPMLLEAYVEEGVLKLNESERYRVEEFKSIVDQLNRYFNMNFELHYLSTKQKRGKYHPDTFELLTSEHIIKRGHEKVRFTIESQKAYIRRVLVVDSMVSKALDMNLTDEVLDLLLDRLEKIY